jgi:methionine biosynthesis protein MetW
MGARPEAVEQNASPDEVAAGLVHGVLNPLRYDGHVLDTDEVSGIVTRMIPKGARVLEVGCGTGSLSRIVADTCSAEVVGIEPDLERAGRARMRGLEVHAGYLSSELIHKIGLFDVVLLADVLEHLSSPQTMLLMSRKTLRAGGAAIVSVPNVAHWSVRADILRGRFQYQPSGIMDVTHLRWFTLNTLLELIASSGFEVTTYRATAGLSLSESMYRRPLLWLPISYRMRLVRFGCRHLPSVFGCQHVLKARVV